MELKVAGVYSLDGDDLKISYPKLRDKGVLPDDFTAAKGSGRQMSILKRMKFAGEPSPKDEEPPANRRNDIPNKKTDKPAISDHSWANKLFKDRKKDFGDCQLGEQLKHRFQMTNVWKLPLEIKDVQVSCGCVTYSLSKQTLQPEESGYLEISMDSTRFSGPKSASILVNVQTKDGVYRSTATLTVSANVPPSEQRDSDISKDKADAGKKMVAVANTDLERMQGVWQVVSCEGGKNAVWSEPMVFMVDGKRACWQGKDDNLQGGLYLDPTSNPKTYDFASHRRTWEGLYSLDGDTLQLCYEMGSDSLSSGAKRPTRLLANGNQILVTLKRFKGPEVFDYRLMDGSKAWPPIIEAFNDKLVQPPLSAPAPAKQPANIDHEKLRGTWKVIKVKTGGAEEMPPAGLRWSFGKDKIVWTASEKDDRTRVMTYLFRGDGDIPASARNNIDITMTTFTVAFPGRFEYMVPIKLRGVFAMEGDKLTLCFRPLNDGERPAEIPLSTAKDDKLQIWIFQRVTALPETDEEKLQGEWKFIGGEVNGNQMPISALHKNVVGDLMICPEEQREEFFRLDATITPKQISLISKSGNVERKAVGIYVLDGDDLKFCFPSGTNAIPDAFNSPPNSERCLMTFKRVKSAEAMSTSAPLPSVEASEPQPAN